MNKVLSALEDVQHLATSLASVANNAKQVDLLILGGGRGGIAMLEVLQQFDWVNIHAIVDNTENAIAFPMARQSGIHTSIDSVLSLKRFKGDIVIDVTGDNTMLKNLSPSLLLRRIELISGKSAKLLFDLVTEKLRNEKTIQAQNSRLDILDSLLEISMQLENRPPLTDILNQSLAKLYVHVHAIKGMAFMFNGDGSGEVVSVINTTKPACEVATCASIQTACEILTKHHRFKTLPQPIQLHNSTMTALFNTILPLWHQDRLAAVLLMDIPDVLNRDQRTAMSMASIHLNMAAKTLEQYNKLERMAIHDRLTGTYNRHYFEQKINTEISRIRRSPHASLTCAFIDIDDFKQVNDTYGHPAGDSVIIEIAQSIQACIRDYDICARYGGDEFILLLPADSPDEHIGLEQVGLRILQHITNIKISKAPKLKVSASIGMATQSSETLDAKLLLDLADQALYEAKAAGKNCLHLHSDQQFHIKGS